MHVEVVETTTCARSRCDCVIFRLGKPGRLLNKLKSYNISDKLIAWIQDFLCNRKQSIRVNCEFSTWFDVLSGIPQGSILGPLLFQICINDLPDLCALQDVNTKIYLYANDAKIYKVINQMPDQSRLQAVVNLVKNWSDEWLLCLNIDKCKTVAYHGEVYSMTKTMTPDPGKYDPGKLNDDPDSMTTLNYDMLSLDLAK